MRLSAMWRAVAVSDGNFLRSGSKTSSKFFGGMVRTLRVSPLLRLAARNWLTQVRFTSGLRGAINLPLHDVVSVTENLSLSAGLSPL